MKKLMYLFVAGTMFIFTACSGEKAAQDATSEEAVTEEAGTEDDNNDDHVKKRR